MGQIQKEDEYRKLKLEEKGDFLDYCAHFKLKISQKVIDKIILLSIDILIINN